MGGEGRLTTLLEAILENLLETAAMRSARLRSVAANTSEVGQGGGEKGGQGAAILFGGTREILRHAEEERENFPL